MFSTITSAFAASRMNAAWPSGDLQVQRDRALVAVQVLEVEAVARPAISSSPLGRRLDADDVGAPVGEMAHAVGPARARVRSSTVIRAQRQRSSTASRPSQQP